jgi:hypothetical protein
VLEILIFDSVIEAFERILITARDKDFAGLDEPLKSSLEGVIAYFIALRRGIPASLSYMSDAEGNNTTG